MISSNRTSFVGLAASAVLIVLFGCSPSPKEPRGAREMAGGERMSMTIESPAFKSTAVVPRKHTGDGADVSPPLAWTGVPTGTVELALICDDPDAPTPQPWVHWVIAKIPASKTSLPEGVPRTGKLDDPPGAVQGVSSWPSDNLGYRGPAPPPGHGTHHYHFKLYALSSALPVSPGLTKAQLLAAMEGHVLAEAELIGTYER